MKILLIDDDDSIRRLVSYNLTKADYEVITAENGLIGKEKAESENPDLIVCDVMMPVMDGYDLLRSIREKKSRTDLPIIMLTAKSQSNDVSFAMTLGANDYLVKPFDNKILLDRVEKQLTITDENAKKKVVINSAETIKRAKDIIESIEDIPSLPGPVAKLQKLAENYNVVTNDIAKVIALDPALTGKVLALVNSSVFGLQRKVTSLSQAVIYLGLKVIRNISMASGFYTLLNTGDKSLKFYYKIWKHSIAVAMASEAISNHLKAGSSEELFACGTLMNIGKLIELKYFHEDFLSMIKLAESKKTTLLEAELQFIGSTHIEIADCLFKIWNIPITMREVIKGQYDFMNIDIRYRVNASILHFADYMVKKLNFENGFDFNQPKLQKMTFKILNLDQNNVQEYYELFKDNIKNIEEFLDKIQ